ncbi:MAG: CoA-binding protein [Gammaproteobacteria bacterium]|nr:CoA-binding protein [Gammaproteobacteria bacterium]
MSNIEHHVVVLGATPKPGRFAHQAVLLLKKHEYKITPVHPRFEEIEGISAVKYLSEINDPVQTLTLYVGASKLDNMVDEVLDLNPQRVIFNPGTESRALQKALSGKNIQWVEDCTLVMLNSGTF